MSIESLKRRSLPTIAAVTVTCLALVSGCSSTAKSTGASGSAGTAGATGSAGSAAGGSQTAAGGGSATTAAGGGSGSTSGSGSVKAACPSPAVVAAALGYTFPAPTQNSEAGGVLCNYGDAAGDNLVIIFAPLPGASPAVLRLAMDSQAQAQKAADTPVPGLGDAAYLFTMNDAATNPDKTATTNLAVLVGSEDVDITASAPADKVEALAKSIVGG